LAKERFPRKGAKTQRKLLKRGSALRLCGFACEICARLKNFLCKACWSGH
jgi:hypothetical protein